MKTEIESGAYLTLSLCENEDRRALALECHGCKRFVAMGLKGEGDEELGPLAVSLRRMLREWCDEPSKYCLPIKPDEDT